MKIKLTVEYDGTNYHGWQIQQNCESIQAVLERALATFLRTHTRVAAAGRTDAGVHALVHNLALELAGDKIRINAVAPAVVETPLYSTFMTKEQVQKTLPNFNAFHPLRRNG